MTIPEIGDDFLAEHITLATLRNWAERATAVPGGTDRARGYEHAARDVLAILDMHGRPPHEPVVFPSR